MGKKLFTSFFGNEVQGWGLELGGVGVGRVRGQGWSGVGVGECWCWDVRERKNGLGEVGLGVCGPFSIIHYLGCGRVLVLRLVFCCCFGFFCICFFIFVFWCLVLLPCFMVLVVVFLRCFLYFCFLLCFLFLFCCL